MSNKTFNWRAFGTILAFVALSGSLLAEDTGPGTCDPHANSCPVDTVPLQDVPVGTCPQNVCASVMPPASLFCDQGICDAYPQGVISSFSYDWSVSNSSVAISAVGPQLFYSCQVNTNVLITVTVHSELGQSTAQQLVACRRPLSGSQQTQ